MSTDKPQEPIVYTRLKDLHLKTDLVREGQPTCALVAPASGEYGQQARRLQQCIEELTGVQVSIVTDDSPAAAVPLTGNLILLGHRSTNRAIGKLYDLFYTMLDLRYPGPGGYEVRTLHNPFGNGHNVVFVGGSDLDGVNAATDAFVAQLRSAASVRTGAADSLSVGNLMEVKLGRGLTVPTELRDAQVWEASAGSGSVGYFGWNSLSKRLALYYMTGDEFHAREFLRLAFPDAQVLQELTEIDEERIENKNDPIAGPYHYNGYLMILLWDLVEESPVFSNEERLRVTNAFSRQLFDPGGYQPGGVYNLTETPPCVGDRHAMWAAIQLFCLCRYFETYYPNPLSAAGLRSAKLFFSPLHQHAWVRGEGASLPWVCTGVEPVLTYMLLSGDRQPVANGVLHTILRNWETLISGRQPDWALHYASLACLHKAAYLAQDSRWILYRQRTGQEVDLFRLGQSYWPEDSLPAASPNDLVGRWSVNCLTKEAWRDRKNGLPLEHSFLFASCRSATDASGDFALLVGLNDYGRTPYYAAALVELRLAGRTLLQGYRNQVFTTAKGLAKPHLSRDAALRQAEVTGDTALAVTEVPCAGWCRWRRILALRTGRFVVFADELTLEENTESVDVQFQWETPSCWRKPTSDGLLQMELRPRPKGSVIPGLQMPDGQAFVATEDAAEVAEIRFVDRVVASLHDTVATWNTTVAMSAGVPLRFFSLLSLPSPVEQGVLSCVRLALNAAALALPEPALAVQGTFEGVQAEFAVVANDHLFGHGLTGAVVRDVLLQADAPVDVDWHFTSGILHVVLSQEARLILNLESGVVPSSGGQPVAGKTNGDGLFVLNLPTGRWVIEGALPSLAALTHATEHLTRLLTEGRTKHEATARPAAPATPSEVATLRSTLTVNVGGPVADMTVIRSTGQPSVCIASGSAIYILTEEGHVACTMSADAAISVLRWWPEHELLLAGCDDDQVIAFTLDGARRWVFHSEEDPAVFRAAKQYWFRSAPGHGGIHGLHTGAFDSGRSRAFVGSACTLEILDENGGLVKRMPVFWGPGSVFELMDGPDESVNLVFAREPGDSSALAVVNSRAFELLATGAYNAVPPGHTEDCGGFASTNRHHLFYLDLDGDGLKELVSDINGTLNRVTVWNVGDRRLGSYDGQPLSSAQFGVVNLDSGRTMGRGNRQYRGIRDLDVADLHGDGKQDIVVALSNGWIVALTWQCERIWSTKLSSLPMVMKGIGSPRRCWPSIVVGCEDGSVAILDSQGGLMCHGTVNGIPTCIDALTTADDVSLALLATDRGEVAGFVP